MFIFSFVILWHKCSHSYNQLVRAISWQHFRSYCKTHPVTHEFECKYAEIIYREKKRCTVLYAVYHDTCCSHTNRSTSSVTCRWWATAAVWRSSGLGRVCWSEPLPPPGWWRLCPASSVVLWPTARAKFSVEWDATAESKVMPEVTQQSGELYSQTHPAALLLGGLYVWNAMCGFPSTGLMVMKMMEEALFQPQQWSVFVFTYCLLLGGWLKYEKICK